jgi:hypothetical protein
MAISYPNDGGSAVVIILCLYAAAMWAVFFRFKLVRWGWLSGAISIVIGGFILGTPQSSRPQS